MKFTSGRSKFATKVIQTGLVTLVFASGLSLTFVSVIGSDIPTVREWFKVSTDESETTFVPQSGLEVAAPEDAVAVTAPTSMPESVEQSSVEQTDLPASSTENIASASSQPAGVGANDTTSPVGGVQAQATASAKTETPAQVVKEVTKSSTEEGYVSTADPFGTELDRPEKQAASDSNVDQKFALDSTEVVKKKKTTKRATAMVEDDRSYEEHLREAFASVDEELANPSDEPPFLIGDLELSQGRAWKLLQMNQRLRRDLKLADAQNAKGSRRILINDHLAWAKEFLGREKFLRYQELNPDLRPETLSRAQESDEISERRRSGT